MLHLICTASVFWVCSLVYVSPLATRLSRCERCSTLGTDCLECSHVLHPLLSLTCRTAGYPQGFIEALYQAYRSLLDSAYKCMHQACSDVIQNGGVEEQLRSPPTAQPADVYQVRCMCAGLLNVACLPKA